MATVAEGTNRGPSALLYIYIYIYKNETTVAEVAVQGPSVAKKEKKLQRRTITGPLCCKIKTYQQLQRKPLTGPLGGKDMEW